MKQIYSATPVSLQRWFWWLILANLLFIGWSILYLQPLTFGEMVRFEVAKQVPKAEAILEEWKATGKMEKAFNSIYIDYLFIILYTSLLSVASLFLSRLTGHEVLIRTGKFTMYMLLAAGICDTIENFSILKSLRGGLTHFNVMLTYDMAAAKFSVIILCLLFLLVCVLFQFINKVDR